MITTKLHKTLSAHSPVFVGLNDWFSVHRVSDDADGVRCVEVTTRHPKYPRFLTSRPVPENKRHEVFPGIFVTVRDASEQSRVKVLIEAPPSVRIRTEAPVALPAESKLLRRVPLPVAGAMYLHSMPGRREPLAEAVAAIADCGITRVVCLAPPNEIAKKSPTYAKALGEGVVWLHDPLPIPDYGVPSNVHAFWSHAAEVAALLQQGGRILVHCGAGIGRTGTFAVAVALKLGMTLPEAKRVVAEAGSGPETEAQRTLVTAMKT